MYFSIVINFVNFAIVIVGCAIWGGGHLLEQVPCLDVPINTFCHTVFSYWLFFIFICLFILLLFVLSNIFDLIWTKHSRRYVCDFLPDITAATVSEVSDSVYYCNACECGPITSHRIMRLTDLSRLHTYDLYEHDMSSLQVSCKAAAIIW